MTYYHVPSDDLDFESHSRAYYQCHQQCVNIKQYCRQRWDDTKRFCHRYRENIILIGVCIFYVIYMGLFFGGLIYSLIPGPKRYMIDTIDNEVKKDYGNYIVSFNETLRLPNYVYYKLGTLTNKYCDDCFFVDDYLHTRNKTSFDMIGFHLGQLVFNTNTNDSYTTFSMANVVPMIKYYHDGIFTNITKHIKIHYMNHNVLIVPDYNIDRFSYDHYLDKLTIPIGFYQIVMDDNGVILFKSYSIHTDRLCDNFDVTVSKNDLPYFMYRTSR